MTRAKQPNIGEPELVLDRGIPFYAGDVRGTIFGGPYRVYSPGVRRLVGVKMAAEIDRPFDVSIPTQDFSVPAKAAMQAGVLSAISLIANGNDVYAGCMGGVGRTGLFMGCMAKVAMDYAALHPTMRDSEGLYANTTPVKFVRKHYKSHAIETDEQQRFVMEFDTGPALDCLEAYQLANVYQLNQTITGLTSEVAALKAKLLVKPTERVVEVFTEVEKPRPYRSPLDRLFTFWIPD